MIFELSKSINPLGSHSGIVPELLQELAAAIAAQRPLIDRFDKEVAALEVMKH